LNFESFPILGIVVIFFVNGCIHYSTTCP
jgi:hypothetical protein